MPQSAELDTGVNAVAPWVYIIEHCIAKCYTVNDDKCLSENPL